MSAGYFYYVIGTPNGKSSATTAICGCLCVRTITRLVDGVPHSEAARVAGRVAVEFVTQQDVVFALRRITDDR